MILNFFPLPAGTYSWTSPFGWRTHPVTGARSLHRGQDLGASQGTPIYATISGRLSTGFEAGGAGNWVNISSGNITVKCFHLSRYAGAPADVQAGTVIGYVGTTGSSTGPHLHFELWQNGAPIDPAPELRAAPHVGQVPPAPTPEEEEDVSIIAWDNGGAFEVWGLFKRHLASMEEVNSLRFIGVKDIGLSPNLLSLRTEITRDKMN